MRFLSRLTFIYVIAVGVSACTSGAENHSAPFANGRPVGEVRGTMLVNKQIQRRVLDADAATTDNFQIELVAGPEIFGMRGLLGEYSEGGAHVEFRGGEPNPFGMLLWHQVAARFAEGLGKVCASTPGDRNLKFFGTGNFTMSTAFADKLAANCDNDFTETELKTNASKLWRAFMGIGVSAEEGPWVEFFTSPNSAFAGVTGADRVSAMVMAMFLNPHMLLEK